MTPELTASLAKEAKAELSEDTNRAIAAHKEWEDAMKTWVAEGRKSLAPEITYTSAFDGKIEHAAEFVYFKAMRELEAIPRDCPNNEDNIAAIVEACK